MPRYAPAFATLCPVLASDILFALRNLNQTAAAAFLPGNALCQKAIDCMIALGLSNLKACLVQVCGFV